MFEPQSRNLPQAILVREVSKRYDDSVLALSAVDLSVSQGELVVLLGPSGCGKSTLLNLIGCIDSPTSGEVFIEGRSTAQLSDDELTALRRDRIGTVFQFFNLIPTLTLAENVALPLLLQRRSRAETDQRVRDAMELVGITSRAGAYPAQASGGEMQRAAIARAVVHEPAIVLADEPTGNLDSRSGEIVLDLLCDIAQRGQAVLMATHSEEAAARSNRRVRMRDGRIVS